jgi:hypothetical protein
MRAELAEAVGGLVSHADEAPCEIGANDIEELVKAARRCSSEAYPVVCRL